MNFNKYFDHSEIKQVCHQIWFDTGLSSMSNKSRETQVLFDNGLSTGRSSETSLYTILIPPLNLSGNAHFGHAYNLSIQDSLIRHQKLLGNDVALIPGVDHGGISTEGAVTKYLALQGIKKSDLTRDEFLNYVHAFTEEKRVNILNQFRELGCFCDWNKVKYTKSPEMSNEVINTFIKFWDEGLIYKGLYPSNWCASCKTALSDDELVSVDIRKSLYYIKYELVGSSKDSIVHGTTYIMVATTRPETIFADVALAISPKDSRYTHLHSQSVYIPTTRKIIPIILDNYVDINFGTGVLKITPAHDKNDHKIGQKHKLGHVSAIDESLNMVGTTRYDGMNINKCRKLFLDELREGGYLDHEELINSVNYNCYRCDTLIETLLSEQFFLRMERFLNHLKNSTKINFYPQHCRNNLNDYLNNNQDWCISRQLYWGHRIPVWICGACNEASCGKYTSEIIECNKCRGPSRQINDVLDTWFSSAMWPFAIFGEQDNRSVYFPSTTLVTGKDIIFFWVARMIMFSKELCDIMPFKNVLFHGAILGNNAKKMTKTRGNVQDPLDVINKDGADVLRLALLWHCASDNNVVVKNEIMQESRKKITKVWNMFRYYLMNIVEAGYVPVTDRELDCANIKNVFNRWILFRLANEIRSMNEHMHNMDIMAACRDVINFVHNIFCNQYLEMSRFLIGDDREETWEVFSATLIEILKLLHPFMPYVTEYCYQELIKLDIVVKRNTGSILEYPYNIPNVIMTKEEIICIDNFVLTMGTLRNLKTQKQKLEIVGDDFISEHKGILLGILKVGDADLIIG